MLTELESYKGIIPYKNPGGMGTNAPMVAKELEKLGCRVVFNKPEEDYDVLHVHSPLPNSFAWAIRRHMSGKPLVVHGRHLPELIKGGFKGGSLFYPFVRCYSVYFYNLGDVVLGATPYVAKSLARDGVKGPFKVIPNGINREVFVRDEKRGAEFRERLGVRPGEKLVVSVGLRIPRKGVDTFINISSILSKTEGFQVRMGRGERAAPGGCARQPRQRQCPLPGARAVPGHRGRIFGGRRVRLPDEGRELRERHVGGRELRLPAPDQGHTSVRRVGRGLQALPEGQDRRRVRREARDAVGR
ncbi:MAG TPA: glycosyltransferase family 4 protein [Thermoplasmata archaeon]|nr:glycosyltransferase family 4 protein [Thermoplasmata archaeon]